MPKSYHQVRLNPHLHQNRQQRVTCQLLRSVSAWSCGFIEADLVEQSIHDAYIQTITKAQHYVYIENQFFITTRRLWISLIGQPRRGCLGTTWVCVWWVHLPEMSPATSSSDGTP